MAIEKLDPVGVNPYFILNEDYDFLLFQLSDFLTSILIPQTATPISPSVPRHLQCRGPATGFAILKLQSLPFPIGLD